LLLNLQPNDWIINDINKDLINCWESVKNNPNYLALQYKKHVTKLKVLSKKQKQDYCKVLTSKIEKMLLTKRRAATYLLVKHCAYMGNIYVNNKMFFSGLDMHIYIENKFTFVSAKALNNLFNISNFLKDTKGKIYNQDYKKVLKKAKSGDFVFLDPPYFEEDHSYDFQYNLNEKLNKMETDLLQELKKLDDKNVMWMMTQSDTKKNRKLYEKYHIKKIKVCRYLSMKSKYELVIRNYC
jgi:DNA adenine methylase